jgi:lactate permease
MPVTFAFWMLAISPILFLVLCMTVFRMSGAKAGILTWIVAQLIAFFAFGARLDILQYANFKAFFLALDVMLIIWGAMYLFQVTQSAGSIQKIGSFLSEFSNSKAYLGIFLGWLFPSFLQGMGGFGVPIAVSAPLLVSAGFSPILSVILASIGHGWGVSFGSMGTSVRTMEAVTGLPIDAFAPASAILLGITAILSGLVVVFLAGGKKEFVRALPLTLLCGLILSAGQYAIARTDFWIMAVTLPSLISLAVGIFLVGTLTQHSRKWLKEVDHHRWNEILFALAPYALLVLLILFFNFFIPLRTLLEPLGIQLPFPSMSTDLGYQTPAEWSKRINFSLHPGTILILTGIVSFMAFDKKGSMQQITQKELAKTTLRSTRSTCIAIFSLVGAAVTMQHAGMISLLAEGISTIFSRHIYPLVAPFIGALGAFITGSNNNSNVLFAALQLQTAELLRLPPAWILAAQTTGAALGSIMAPAKVILGCNTVGLEGKEGQVISRLILICLAIIFTIGLFTLAFTR